VRSTLQTIDKNEEFIKMALAMLMTQSDRSRAAIGRGCVKPF
jgi:hypothetical protein